MIEQAGLGPGHERAGDRIRRLQRRAAGRGRRPGGAGGQRGHRPGGDRPRPRSCWTRPGTAAGSQVVQADAENPLPGLDEPFDAILVTVGAWDLAPAWLEHLADGRHDRRAAADERVTRSIALPPRGRPPGEHLGRGVRVRPDAGRPVPTTSGSSCCPTRNGHHVKLRFDGDVPAGPRACSTGCWRPSAPRCGPVSRSSTACPSPTCTCGSPASCPASASWPWMRAPTWPPNARLVPLRRRARRLVRLPGGAPGAERRRSRVRRTRLRRARRGRRDRDGRADPGLGPPGRDRPGPRSPTGRPAPTPRVTPRTRRC